jgi:hypothetical protein
MNVEPRPSSQSPRLALRPTNTAVQLRQPGSGTPRSELVYGNPHALVAGKLGAVALFAPDELVAYRIRDRRQTRLFVFKTLEVDDRLAARLPGVSPRVQLLFDVRTAGRARLVRGLFAYLVKAHDAPALPDSFYVRLGVVLGGRLPAHKILTSLLSRSTATSPCALVSMMLARSAVVAAPEGGWPRR